MSEGVKFQRVAVLGTGLLGGSFALAVKRAIPGVMVAGYDRRETLEAAKSRGAIDEGHEKIAEAVRGADLVYVALPIIATIQSLGEIAEAAAPEALVTDACSTKATVCHEAAEKFRDPGKAKFLGGHPMAGKEASGVERAAAELFRGAPYVLVGVEPGDRLPADERVEAFVGLLEKIGAEPVWFDAETHDWAVGIVSHLPQMVAIALARVVEDETDETGLPISLAGGGLRDTLRLAASPYSVWRDICLTNTENLRRALDQMQQAVEHLRTHLTNRELEAEFRGANEIYRALQKGQG